MFAEWIRLEEISVRSSGPTSLLNQCHSGDSLRASSDFNYMRSKKKVQIKYFKSSFLVFREYLGMALVPRTEQAEIAP